jgi:HEAT repeat protein
MTRRPSLLVSILLLGAHAACSPSGAAPRNEAVERAAGPLVTTLASAAAAAACALRDLGDLGAMSPKAIAALEPLLADNRRVEGLACGNRMWSDGAEWVRITSPALEAANALAGFMPDAFSSLVRTLQASSAVARAYAAYGLGESGDPRAGGPLVALLGDSSGDVRERAAEALGKLEEGQATQDLQSLLQDPDARVRRAAVEALA